MDRLTDSAVAELAAICPGGVIRDVELAKISWWRIGGLADLVLRPSSTEEVAALMRWFSACGIKPVVIGMTTNLLFADAGLRTPCIQLGGRMAMSTIKGSAIQAQAGAWVPGLARNLMKAGLGGVEHICGIPGTLGGLICMNGGSQRNGVGNNIVTVESVDTKGRINLRTKAQCDFAYRKSVFQSNHEIITSAQLQLTSRPVDDIRSDMRKILADRRNKFPRKQPSCGSVFKSDPAMYAQVGAPGAVIERLGLKGLRIGDALVSPQHANFFVNAGAARASDMLALISKVSDAVYSATDFRMEPEVYFVEQTGGIVSVFCSEGGSLND